MTSALACSPRVKKYQGQNGVTLLQQDNPGSRAFCVGVWINTGSRDESMGEEGLCHFFEHMVFKGTGERTALQLSQAIEKVGGALEGFSTKEQVCIYAQVLDTHFELASEILEDMIVHSTFPEEQIVREKDVVLGEINDVMDTPDDLIHDLFASEVFPGHPLGRPVLGAPDTVSRFSASDLRRFSRQHITGNNIVVAVLGSIDKRRLMRICDWVFRLPSRPVRHRATRVQRYQPARKLHRRKLHQQHICIGGRACALSDEHRYASMVLTTLLGGTMSSRLFQRIREELGYSYMIYTYTDSLRDTGILGTYVSVKPSNAGRVVSEIFREFEKVRRGDVGGAELSDTKEYLKGQILLGLETSASKMMRMARNEIYFGRQISERELIRKIDAVTMDDVMEIAADALAADNNTIVSLGPSGAGLGSGASG